MSAPALPTTQTLDAVRDRLVEVGGRILPRAEEVEGRASAAADQMERRPSRSSWLRPVLLIGMVTAIAIVAVAWMAVSMSWKGFRARAAGDAPGEFDRMGASVKQADDGLLDRERAHAAAFGVAAGHEVGPSILDDHDAEVG